MVWGRLGRVVGALPGSSGRAPGGKILFRPYL